MNLDARSLARLGLIANGALSLATGLALTFGAAAIGDRLGVDIDGWLRVFGVALIAHAAIIAIVIRRADLTPWLRINLAVVAPYPALMIGVIAFGLIQRGHALVLLDGLLVGLVALAQWIGLRRMNQVPAISPA